MATDRPLVVLAGPIHADGKAQLERSARRRLRRRDRGRAGQGRRRGAGHPVPVQAAAARESLMAACQQLKVVGPSRRRASTPWTSPPPPELGVAVVHAPGSNSQAVAEHALMLMLVCVKRRS